MSSNCRLMMASQEEIMESAAKTGEVDDEVVEVEATKTATPGEETKATNTSFAGEETKPKDASSSGSAQDKKQEEPPTLDSQLLNLLTSAKTGDTRTLQKMTIAAKKFLYESNLKKDNEMKRSISPLLQYKGFIPDLLMKCLKSNVAKIPVLVSDSLWILNSILSIRDATINTEVDAVVKAGAVPLMVKLVSVQENIYNVNSQALAVLEHFAYRGYRDELMAAGSGLIFAMTKMAKKKNCNARLQKMMVQIVSAILGRTRSKVVIEICTKPDPVKGLTGSYKEMIENLPPLDMVKDVIPLLNLLLNTKDDDVLEKALSCLAFGGCVKGSFQYILDTGILKKVTQYFSHSNEIVRFFSITVVSSIASPDDDKSLAFLKSMKGSFALKEFYRGLTSSNDALVWAADQFFTAAVNAITTECDVPTLNAVITSGFVHSLVHCLKPGMHEKHVLGSAWAIGRISSEVPLAQRRVIVEAGALPLLVEQLKNTNEIVSAMSAMSIGNLAQEKPLNRDQVVALGAIPLLIELVHRKGSSLQGLISVLACLEMIVDVKPAAPAEVMKDVPSALISVLDNKSIKFPDKLIPGIYSIVWKLCESGSDGIDTVIKSGFLSRLEIALSNGSVDTMTFALEAVETISRGSQEQRDAMFDVGIVRALIDLLQNSVKYVRRVAWCALANLYKGQLTPERRLCIQQIVPQVITEMTKQDPRTNHPAGLSFQNVFSNFRFN